MPPSQSTPQLLTAADYLTYNDGTDDRYELVNGILTEMPPESNLNARIAFCSRNFSTWFPSPACATKMPNFKSPASKPASGFQT